MLNTPFVLGGGVLAEGRLTNWATIAFMAMLLLGVVVIVQLVRFRESLRGLEMALEEQAQKIENLQRVAGLSPPEE